MSDFEARVKATLDTSELDQKLKNIKGTEVKVKINTGSSSQDLQKVNQQAVELKKSLNIGSAAALTAKGIQLIGKASKDAVQAVKNIDQSITNLRMATGQSYQDTAKLVKSYNDMGKTMGATTVEVSDSADAWLRQGHNIKETNELIRDSMILSKVANLESADSTTYLTSAMKGYQVAANNVISIVDKLTAVDLVSATSAGGLAEAMSRTAVSANMTGISMDKLLGYLAVTGEVTQKSMDSVGESFKTIFTRMADIKANKLEFINEDGTKESLSQVETVLNALDIKLRDSNLQFRNFGDVLDEVAANWGTYSNVQQSAISKAFAGTRQSENFKVLMENYQTAQKYMETSINSAGTAEKKFEAYTDSIEAKTKSLQAAFESLAFDTISSELVGGLTESATAVVEFLDKTNILKCALAGVTTAGAIKGFTVLSAGISNAAMRMSQFNSALSILKSGNIADGQLQQLAGLTQNLSQSQLKAVLSSKALTAQQRISILTAQGMSTSEAQAAVASMGLAAAEGTATAATFSLSDAFKGLMATLAANPLVLVTAGVTAAFAAYSSYQQHMEELRSEAEASAKSFSEVKSSMEDYVSQVNKLRGSLNSGNLSESEAYETKKQLLDIQTQLNDTYGKSATGLDLMNGKLEDQIDKIRELAALEASEYLNKNAETIAAAEREMTKTLGGEGNWVGKAGTYLGQFYDNGLDDTSRLKEILGKYGDFIQLDDMQDGTGTVRIRFVGDAKDAKSVLNDLMTDLRNTSKDFEDSNVFDAIFAGTSAIYKSADDTIQKYETILETAKQARLIEESYSNAKKIYTDNEISKTAAEWLNDYTVAVKEYNNALLSGDTAIIADAKAQFDSLDASINNLIENDDGFAYFSSMFDDVRAAELSIDNFKTELAETQNIEFLAENINSVDNFNSAVTTAIESQTKLQTALGKSRSASGLAKEDIDSINESFKSLGDGYDPSKLFMATENGIKINSDYFNKYSQQLESITKQNLYEKIIAKQEELNKAIQDGDKERAKALKDDLEYFNLQYSQYSGATSRYNKYVQASSSANNRDSFENVAKGLSGVKTLIDGGWTTDDSVTSYLDLLLSPEKIEQAGSAKKAFEELGKTIPGVNHSLKDYFTFDKSGNLTSKGLWSFVDDVNAKLGESFASIEDGKYTLDLTGKNIETIAKEFGTTTDFIELMAEALQDAGMHVDLDPEPVRQFKNEIKGVEEESKSVRDQLKEIKENGDANITVDLDYDSSSMTADELDSKIKELTDQKNNIELDVNTSDEAKKSLALLEKEIKNLQKQKLNLKINAALAGGKTIDELLGLDDPNLKQTLDIDDSQIAEVRESLQSLKDGTQEIPLTVKIDESQFSSLIGANNTTVKVTPVVDKAPEVPDADAKVNYSLGSYPRSAPAISGKAYYSANFSNIFNVEPPRLKGTVDYYKGTVTQASGTMVAHSDGTAYNVLNYSRITPSYAGGARVSLKKDETALTNEVGNESIVRNGVWYMLPPGPHIEHLKKGDIVFSAKQTADLLRAGRTNTYARALSAGTLHALAEGSLMNAYAGTYTGTNPWASAGSGSSSGGTGGGNASDAYKAGEKKTDWIEVAIRRIEDAIKQLDIVSSSSFKNLTNRLSASAEQISAVTREINLQKGAINGLNNAYNRYLEEANKVPLNQDIIDLIHNGAIEISLYDEETQQMITDYQNWYEKALAASDAIEKLNEDIANLYKESFEAVKGDAENRIGMIEHTAKECENQISIAEEKGYIANTKYYESLINVEKSRIDALSTELTDLQEKFDSAMDSGSIEEGSEAYYDMLDAIRDVGEEIDDATLSVIKYSNAVRDIEWKYFDLIQDRLSGINAEAQFLMELIGDGDLFDEIGNINQNGQAIVGLRAQNYNVFMTQADSFAKEIQRIDKELANDPYNTELIDRRRELLDLQREAILSAENEKKAISDLVKNGIEVQLKSLEDLISKYKDTIDSANDLRKYGNDISEQSNNISSLRKQLLAYQGDMSEETALKVQKLQVELKNAEEKMQESEYDQYINDQKKLLDELYDEYEATLNERVDDIDAVVSDLIGATNENSAKIEETIRASVDKAGYTLSHDFNQIWGGALDSVTMYNSDFSNSLTNISLVLRNIDKSIETMKANTGLVDVPRFATGGLARYTGFAYLDGTPDKPELVLNQNDTKNFLELKDYLNDMKFGASYQLPEGAKNVALTRIADVSGVMRSIASSTHDYRSVTFGDTNITIPIDHVDDYNDLVTKMRNDPKFEKLVQTMTLGRIAGGSALSKYGVNW